MLRFHLFLFAITIAPLSAAPPPAPKPQTVPPHSYTIHVRDGAGQGRLIHVRLSDADVVVDAITGLKMNPGDLVRMDIWVVRRTAGGKSQVLPVDWVGISQWGSAATNYQLFAGDRLFLWARPAK